MYGGSQYMTQSVGAFDIASLKSRCVTDKFDVRNSRRR